MGRGQTCGRAGRGPPRPPLWGPRASGHPRACSPPRCWGRGEHPALPRVPRRGRGLRSCSPAASRRSLAQGLPLLPPLCSLALRLRPHRFLLPACTLPAPPGCIAASPGVPRWGAPKYSHVGNDGAGARLQAQQPGGTNCPEHPQGQRDTASQCRRADDFSVGSQGCMKAACQRAEPARGPLTPSLPLPCPGPG